jgi:hypothetical protein
MTTHAADVIDGRVFAACGRVMPAQVSSDPAHVNCQACIAYGYGVGQ